MPDPTTPADGWAHARHRLRTLWDGLESFGAIAARRPLDGLTGDELAALIAGELERLRVLQAPEASYHVLAARTFHRRRAA